MKKSDSKRSISTLAALLLLGLFALSILGVLLTGAGIYQRLTRRDQESYDSRTCVQYVATKVRQAYSPDCVAVSEFGDGECLVLTETIENQQYWTRVYCWDGWLMELFTVADGNFSPEAGEKILPVEKLCFHLENGFLTVELTDANGQESSLLLSMKEGTP